MIPDGKSTTYQYVFTSAQAPDLINYLFLFNYAFVLVLDLRLCLSLSFSSSIPPNKYSSFVNVNFETSDMCISF